MKAQMLKSAVVALLVAGLVGILQLSNESPSEQVMTGLGDVRTLRTAYDLWAATYTRSGGDRRLILPLHYTKGLSAEFSEARGQIGLDLTDGSVAVDVSGLSDTEAFDVWLIDNRPGPGYSVKPEPGDGMVRLGSLTHGQGTATLQTRLGREALAGFAMDLVVIARSGRDPGAAGLLFGSPSLFQRLYYAERGGPLATLADADAGRNPDPALGSVVFAPFRFLVPSPVHAEETADVTLHLASLVAKGERIFFNQRFEGNGRTCGTCHPAENNLTIDPKFIATLPPDDPLFVAEFNPDLAEHFENPTLMRRFGLILENVDGFDDLPNRFVMRGVPHTLALPTSLTPAPAGFDGTTTPPEQRTGWGGDGAPGSGTLREFAIGAVTQHFTKTLNRTPGTDFRLPNAHELDALEAFQLSTGRQADSDLTTLTFKSARAEQGKTLFLGEKACARCHSNAGASAVISAGPTTVTGNFNFNTGIENIPDHPAQVVEPFPRDGGFGRAPDGDGVGGFGDGTFNTPPLIEAADSAPFFHNNPINTIEEAVAFYGTDAFNNSPSGQFFISIGVGPITINREEAQAIGALLRVLNAVENIRSSIALQEGAKDARRQTNAERLLVLSIHEIDDAIRVLQGARLHPGAVFHLRNARALVETAAKTPLQLPRNILIEQAIAEEKAARKRMVVNG